MYTDDLADQNHDDLLMTQGRPLLTHNNAVTDDLWMSDLFELNL